MSDHLFIFLQCALAFGVPLALAVSQLWGLRRKPPAPVGGGDPNVIYLNRDSGLSAPALVEPANSEHPVRRAA